MGIDGTIVAPVAAEDVRARRGRTLRIADGMDNREPLRAGARLVACVTGVAAGSGAEKSLMPWPRRRPGLLLRGEAR